MHTTVLFIRKALSEQKISYSRLAEKIDVDESKIKRILSGKQQMTLEMRDLVFSALGFRVLNHLPYNITANDIIELWMRLPKEMQHSLYIHINTIINAFEDDR